MSIGLKLLQAHSPKVVIFGMSCVGKTTMATLMKEHAYVCFDALFNWHLIEALGLSISTSLNHAADACRSHPKFVLDGWHLSDAVGELLPRGTTAYVLHAPYENVIRQYRVPVSDPLDHVPMYRKWYDTRYRSFAVPVRYFVNEGDQIREVDQPGFLVNT